MIDLFISGRDVYASTLSRKQAMGDGLLIDLTGWAVELGYRIPLACTAEVWRRVGPESDVDRFEANDRRRIRYLLKVLRSHIRALPQPTEWVRFSFRFTGQRKKLHCFVAVCGLGDQFEPVLTVLTPEEAKGVPDGS